MPKFETKVYGTTFYKVDFKSITEKSKVLIVPEPSNIHDKNALKVLIDERHVGYISRDLNQIVLEKIKRKILVTCALKKVTGDRQKNNGIIISISIHEKFEDPPKEREYFGESTHKNPENLVIKPPTHQLNIAHIFSVSWEDFIHKKGLVSATLSIPSEPNYIDLYKKKYSLIKRIFSSMPASFLIEKKKNWMAARDAAISINSEILKIANTYRNPNLVTDYHKSIASSIKENLRYCNITLKSEKDIKVFIQKGYLTFYEQLLYAKLEKEFLVFRQAIVAESLIDILVVNVVTKKIFAIEVDGGIHRLEKISNNDIIKEKAIADFGVSLIRVTNNYIKKDIDSVAKEIIDLINKT